MASWNPFAAKQDKEKRKLELQRQQQADTERAQAAAQDALIRRAAQIRLGQQAANAEALAISAQVDAIRLIARDPLMADTLGGVDGQLSEWQVVVEDVISGLAEIDPQNVELQEIALAEVAQGAKALRLVRDQATQARGRLETERRSRQADNLRLQQLMAQQETLAHQAQYEQLRLDTSNEYTSLAAAARARRVQATADTILNMQVEEERRRLDMAQQRLDLERSNAGRLARLRSL